MKNAERRAAIVGAVVYAVIFWGGLLLFWGGLGWIAWRVIR